MKTKLDPKIVVRYVTRESLGLVVMGVALFWSAGKFAWWPAWAVLAVMFVWVLATTAVILAINPDLLIERLGPRKGAKSWDTIIMSLLGLAQLARYIIAGFDQRFGWSGNFALSVQLSALIFCVLGYFLVVWATASNAFFSQVVRIQIERGQTVVSTGPYAIVRHPAYLGAILFELAAPILLTSWAALSISILTVFSLALRTALEDHTLQTELTGYKDYCRHVRYRLLPGLW